MFSTKSILSLLILAFSLPFLAHSQKSSDWVLKNNKDDIKVYYKKTSDVHEVKLVASIKTSLSGLTHLISDVEMYPTWGYKVAYSKLIEKISDTEMYYYSRLDFPWPLADRDIIMHTKLVQDPNTKSITAISTAAPDKLPENKDIVRIKSANTKWTIQPGVNGWAYVEYYIYSNPGGNMPDWLVNMAIDVGPRETIKCIRQQLKNAKYQAVRLAYIKE